MQELRILHLEDDPFFADMVDSLLKAQALSFRIKRASDFAAFIEALKDPAFDLILSDHEIPGGDGLKALDAARRACPMVPFIFLSGMMGEERAVESLQNGAADYVLKSNMSRFIPTVMRTLNAFREAAALRAAQARIRRDQANLHALIENTNDAIWSMDLHGNVLVFNSAASLLCMKFTKHPMVEGSSFIEALAPELRQQWIDASSRVRKGERFRREAELEWGGGRSRLEFSVHPIFTDREVTGMAVFCREVVERNPARAPAEGVSGSGGDRALTGTSPAPAVPAASAAPVPAGEAGAFASLRILVVEDNPVNQIVVTGYLEQLGCRADVAANGKQAVEACARRTFDLILMDIQMPVLDGYAATESIRAQEKRSGHRAWISAMTASVSAAARERSLACGMDAYLAKPLKIELLKAELEHAAELARKRVPSDASP